jgi:hypothetical protein
MAKHGFAFGEPVSVRYGPDVGDFLSGLVESIDPSDKSIVVRDGKYLYFFKNYIFISKRVEDA